MPARHLVVIGASAGGIEALRELVAALPADFPAPICVVVHTAQRSPGILDAILRRAGKLPAVNAVDRQRLKPGHIFVAPPDRHLLVEPGILRVTRGPKENRFRPAVDPLFRSAAQIYGPAAIGVILTGNLDDGTAGLWVLKQLGGTAIVQDPEEALFPGMPRAAIENVKVDHVVPLTQITPLLVRLTTRLPLEVPPEPVPQRLEVEVKIAKEENPIEAGLQSVSEPSSFACPECHGVLLQLKEGGRLRFRCHTGHAYSMDSLLAAVSDGIEEALWTAVRALEEGGMLLQMMSAHFSISHGRDEAQVLARRAEDARRKADTVRNLVGEREALDVKP